MEVIANAVCRKGIEDGRVDGGVEVVEAEVDNRELEDGVVDD